METSAKYQSYISDLQNLQTTSGRTEYQKAYAENFEKIYNETNNTGIKLNTAQSFIQNLSQSDLNTLQGYSGLVDAIDANKLSPEAAYNLLMHDNEQYDFNADGLTEIGIGKSFSVVPATMPSDVRVAYIDALNSLDGKDKLMAMTLTFDMGRISSLINNTPYTPAIIDYDYLSKGVDRMLNPTGGGFTSQETRESISAFWEAFQESYKSEKSTTKVSQTDPAIEKFLKDLTEKGAVSFLADFNKKKIDDMVKEFRDKLVKEIGDTPSTHATIEKEVLAFKKELLEKLQESVDSTKVAKTDTQAIVKVLLDMKNQEEKPLEKFLKL